MDFIELATSRYSVRGFAPAAVAEAFGIPGNEHPVAVLPLGYPSESRRASFKVPVPSLRTS